MANLEETAKWEDGVYQWETDDPVVGGPDGLDNVPTRQLANRTGYLKAQIEAHAAADDPHPQYLLQSEGDQLYDKAGVAASSLQAHLGAADPHPQYLTDAEAAALIQQNIGQGSTAPQFDNSTKNATTAFVQRALGNFQAVATYSSTATLTTVAFGQMISCTNSSAITLTLPSPSMATSGAAITFRVWGSGAVTLTTPSGLLIDNDGNVSSITFIPGTTVTIVTDGTNYFVNVAKVPQQAQFDNSTKPASTSFVQRALGNFNAYTMVTSAATTLTAAQTGGCFLINATNAVVTLPNTPQSNLAYTLYAGAAFTLTAPSGSIIGPNSSSASISVAAHGSIKVVFDGGNWEIIGGSAVAPMTAATQAQFDNSTALANTAFVLANRGGLGGGATYAAAATMPSSDWGKLIELSSAATAAYSLTLPSLTGGGTYPEMHFTNLGSYNVALYPASGSIAFLGTGRASVTVYPGMSLHIVGDPNNYVATSASLPQLGNPYQTFATYSSRALSTVYYNTTNAPIFVFVSVASGTDIQLGYYVNGVGALQAWAVGSGPQIGSVNFVVPVGASYEVVAVNSSGGVIWNELR